jgi:hypothetical protein
MGNMTKKGARSVTANLDRLATLFQEEFETLGVPSHIASDFARRCDMLSDAIEKKAGIERTALDELDVVKEKGFDPEAIGEEVSGPEEGDSDEPYMRGHFTQQVNRELRERQEDGDLGMTPVEEIQTPQPGKQASFEQIGRLEANNRLSMAVNRLQSAAVRLASAGRKDLSLAVSKLASDYMTTQVGVLNGDVSATQATTVLQAANHLLPHLENVTNETATKVASMVTVAGKIPPQFLENANKKKDEAKDKEEGDEKKGGKKNAGCEKLPEGGMRDNCEKKKSEGGGDEKKDEKEDKKPDFLKDKEEGKESGKKASHGFNLNV